MMTPMHGENLLKKQTNTKIFYCNLESKNLSMHWRHHLSNSRQLTSVCVIKHNTLYCNYTRTGDQFKSSTTLGHDSTSVLTLFPQFSGKFLTLSQNLVCAACAHYSLLRVCKGHVVCNATQIVSTSCTPTLFFSSQHGVKFFSYFFSTLPQISRPSLEIC